MDETLSVSCGQALEHASPHAGHEVRCEAAACQTLPQILAGQPFRGQVGLVLWGQTMGDVTNDGLMVHPAEGFGLTEKFLRGLAFKRAQNLERNAIAGCSILRTKKYSRASVAKQRLDLEAISKTLIAGRHRDRLLLCFEKRVLTQDGVHHYHSRPASGLVGWRWNASMQS